jgi:hypothetical protein
MIPLYYSILIPSAFEQFHASARCPNGSHKSPSGACEQVVPHEGLPRCPNGFHRSPSGICESVNGNNNVAGGSNNNNEINNGNSNTNVLETPSSGNASSLAGRCDQTLWNHVYNPTRLQMVEECKTVSGTVDDIRVEADGDFHILLNLDPQFSDMINSANVAGEHGDLVVEPICMNPIEQTDALAACNYFHQQLIIPSIGTHVNVTGSYVHDLAHGGWSEIHPVTSIIGRR